MTDLQYYNLSRISSSILKWINPLEGGSPMKYYSELHNLEKRKRDSFFMELGKLCHMYKLQPELFSVEPMNKPTEHLLAWADEIYPTVESKLHPDIDLFDILTDEVIINTKQKLGVYGNITKEDTMLKTFKTEQIKAYFSFKKENSGKLLLSAQTKEKISNMQISMDKHPLVDYYVNDDANFKTYKETDILFSLKVAPLIGGDVQTLDLKSKPDLIRCNIKKLVIQLIDIKSSHGSAYQLNNFMSYRIYRQLAVYRQAILTNVELFGFRKSDIQNITFEYKIIAVETSDQYNTVIHKINPMWVTKNGNEEFRLLLKRIAFHEIYGYDQSLEEFKGNGEIEYPYAVSA